MTGGQAIQKTPDRPTPAAIGERTPPSMTTEFLTAFNRPHRYPIPILLRELVQRLDQMESPVSDPTEIASILNRAALMEAQFGRPVIAEKLCHDQIRWVAKHVQPRHGPGHIYLAFQPWINMARLDRMAGRVNQSKEKMDQIRLAFAQQEINLDRLTVRPAHYDLIKEIDPYLQSFLRNSYLTEMLTWAQSDPSPTAIDDAAAAIDVSGSHRSVSIVLEAELLHAIRHGQPPRSIDRVALNPADHNQKRRLALRIRSHAAHGYTGQANIPFICDAMLEIAQELSDQDLDGLGLAMLLNTVGFLADHAVGEVGQHIDAGILKAEALGDCVSVEWLKNLQATGSTSRSPGNAFLERTWMNGLRKSQPEHHRVQVVDEFTQRLRLFVA